MLFYFRGVNVRKNISVVIVFAVALTVFSSCSQNVNAYSAMREFCTSFGIRSVIYSPIVPEGAEGYTEAGFYESLFGEKPDTVSDYAVVLLSGLDYVGECGIFVCYSSYDALCVTEMLERRIEFIRSVSASSGLKFPEQSFVMRENGCVVFAVLPDAEEAKRIWKHII